MNLLRYVLLAATLAWLGFFLYIVATEKYERSGCGHAGLPWVLFVYRRYRKI
jgi:hypothetical protein